MYYMKKIKKIAKPKCSRCESSQVYIRFTTDEIVCRTCGNVEFIKGGSK